MFAGELANISIEGSEATKISLSPGEVVYFEILRLYTERERKAGAIGQFVDVEEDFEILRKLAVAEDDSKQIDGLIFFLRKSKADVGIFLKDATARGLKSASDYMLTARDTAPKKITLRVVPDEVWDVKLEQIDRAKVEVIESLEPQDTPA